MTYSRAYLSELLDRVSDLLVENAPIRDHNDGVEDCGIVLFQTDELMGEPGNGIGLAAACRMLDQVSLSCPVGLCGIQQLSHDVQLVITREDLRSLFPAGFWIFLFNNLRVVFQNVP